MIKKLVILAFVFTLAGSVWGRAYIGEVDYSWATTSTVSATASSTMNGHFSDAFGPDNTLNGGSFGPGSNPTGMNGLTHTYTGGGHSWFSDPNTRWGNGADNPAGLAPASESEPNGVRQWLHWKFDKKYKIHDCLLWSGYRQTTPFPTVCPKEVRIDYSSNGVTWIKLGDYTFNRMPTKIMDQWFPPNNNIQLDIPEANNVLFSIRSNYYYPMEVNETVYNQDKGVARAAQTVMSEIRFYIDDPYASDANKVDSFYDGVKDVNLVTALIWAPGDHVAATNGHRVFFGTNFNDVNNMTTPTVTTSTPSYTPTGLVLGTWYYWRVDEVNDLMAGSPWKGKVWSFRTDDYNNVDAFDTYTSTANLGSKWTGTPTGLQLDTTKFSGGKKSMRMEYQNTTSPNYREEASKTFASPYQNWTAIGIKSLAIDFRGDDVNNVAQPLYLKLVDSANVTKKLIHPDPNAVKSAGWKTWNINLADPNFSGLNKAQIKQIIIGTGETGSSSGQTQKDRIWIDEIRVYATRCITSLTGYDSDLNQDCVVDFLDLEYFAASWLVQPYSITPTDPGVSNLIAYWPFDESTGLTAVDTVNSINGSIYGSGLWVTPGKVGASAYDFKKTAMCQFPFGSPVVNSLDKEATISMWVFGDTYQSSETSSLLMDSRDQGELKDMISWQCLATTTTCVIGSDIGFGAAAQDSVSYNWPSRDFIGKWVHLAVTKNANTGGMVMYKDGTLLAASYGKTRPIQGNLNYFFAIAGHPAYSGYPTHYFNGKIDEVRIYNRALSQAEVAYLAGFTSPIPQPMFPLSADTTDRMLIHDEKIDFKDFADFAAGWWKPLKLFP